MAEVEPAGRGAGESLGSSGGGPPAAGPEFDRLARLVLARAFEIARYSVYGDVADDIAQEVAISFWQAWKAGAIALTDDAVLERWIHTSVRTHLIDRVRANLRRKERNLEYDGMLYKGSRGWSNPDTALSLREFEAVIQGSVVALPPRRCEVYRRVREDGLSHKEVADERGVSEPTIAYHVTAALKTLRETVFRYQGHAPAPLREAPPRKSAPAKNDSGHSTDPSKKEGE